MRRYMSIPLMVEIIGLTDALIYILYKVYIERSNRHMGTAEVVAIVVAVLGVASGVWCQIIQFKKDSGAISGVKADASEIKPEVKNIDKNVEKVRDEVVEKIVPKMTKLDGIDLLVEDYKFRQKVKSGSSNLISESQLKLYIEGLFESNASLNTELKNVREELLLYRNSYEQLQIANREIARLNAIIENNKQEITKLKLENQRSKQQYRDDELSL